MLKVITIASPSWEWENSYGRLSHELRSALQRLGYVVNAIGADSPDSMYIPTMFNLLLGYPTLYQEYGTFINAGHNVALTMFESTKLPKGWRDNLNRTRAVIVPCDWNVDVFRANGVTSPIVKAPLGISDTFTYQPRKASDKFRFICFGDRGVRKGSLKAMSAFVKAFGSDESVELVIKARRNPFAPPFQNIGNKNFRMVLGDMTDEELNALYHECDVMLAPTASEGFGFIPREFAKTGGIALATDYGGTADDIHQWGAPIKITGEVPAWTDVDHMKGLGLWADADVDDLANKMDTLRHTPLAHRNILGKQYADNVNALYTWDKTAAIVDNVLQRVYEETTHGNPNPTG